MDAAVIKVRLRLRQMLRQAILNSIIDII
jgi:hypothetical protein